MKPVEKYVRNLKKDVKSKKGLVNALKFSLVFLVSFLLFLFLILPLTSGFWEGVGSFHAQASHSILGNVGVNSTVRGNILYTEVEGEEMGFVISQLCSGDIEIALLISLLIASLDVLLIWRVLGSILGTGFLLLMNPFRIAITLMITKDSGMEAGDFYHSVIFRLFLFVLLVLYYFVWYRAFVKRKSKLQERLCKKLHV